MSEEKIKLDVSEFGLNMIDNMKMRTNMAVIGLGATGSAFIILLAHFLKNYSRYDVRLYDFDHIMNRNMRVSLYGFVNSMDITYNSRSKALSCYRALSRLSGVGDDTNNNSPDNHNNNVIHGDHTQVDCRVLERRYIDGGDNTLSYIFIFTDNNESRYEVAKYHAKYPDTKVFDCRVGSYSQFEVYYSANPSKYMKTIYFNKDGRPKHIDGNIGVCLDDRMNFSIAMASCSLLMNLFTKLLKDDMKEDFKHIMIGNDYIGEVKGYD